MTAPTKACADLYRPPQYTHKSCHASTLSLATHPHAIPWETFVLQLVPDRLLVQPIAHHSTAYWFLHQAVIT
ncbi:hypothetical protein COCCADRAFT_93848 [Bipolaris zeicola 26-R-13]|uniref:Uncharacterized protein n=1 Tax=Cochliobolus carbonum (strain 26-R-13) TaxID=930089 RepID=W6YRZ9_COCC2|nr:uncharacterized protein COCCADRAFT_93848 [Bipolaris zeicola 26-R-13]EUC34301.1 hypothetical protein COCCADRAFT_93848 [Bipolaris zeicola 26-R-13]